jgi:tetrapyrrole methylase family protein/MazG family protein
MLEFGDILFSLVNVARFAGFHPETALSRSTSKFEERFRMMEADIAKQGLDLKQMPPEEKEKHWQAAKQACTQKKL